MPVGGDMTMTQRSARTYGISAVIFASGLLTTFPAAQPARAVELETTIESTSPIDPNNPQQGRFSDEWAEIFLAGSKVGYAHSTLARDGNLIRTSTAMRMEIGRDAQPITVTVTQNTTETLTGDAIGFESGMDMSVVKTVTKGTIENGRVTIITSQYGMEQTKTFDFPRGALMTWGMLRESLLRGFTPGTEYELQVYAPELRLDGAVTATTKIGEWEEFKHRGTSYRGQKVTLVMRSPIGEMELISWVDRNGIPIRAQVPAAGMGNLEIIKSDEATALAEFAPPELFMTTVVKANPSVDVRNARKVKYRIISKTGKEDLGELPTLGMQTVGKRSPRSAEVVVARQSHAPRSTRASEPSAVNLDEYLDGNLMINTNDTRLIELAKKAGGGETEPFALADRLRRYVTRFVKTKSLNIGFATASEVCRTREGDCSEHAVLLAALGRLHGLPSRVVVGLAYVPFFGGRKDIFGYHMWTQFLIHGQWIDVDAALGETQCTPRRIAFAASSLKNSGLADLTLPLLSKIGAIRIDIVEIDGVSTLSKTGHHAGTGSP